MEIILNNVSKQIRRTPIVCNVSIHLKSGNIYGLQGCNGSGKTMLMRLISGLLKPTSGFIQIDQQILGKDLDFPGSIGVLLENPSFLPNYTGEQNLSLIASIKGSANITDIRKSLLRVGLNPDDKRKYRKYSLGMKQRLGIACAIMESPELLLLDEPTNALDATGVQLITDVIYQERDRGALIILASHDRSCLEKLSNVIYTIEDGRISDVRRCVELCEEE